MTQNESLTDEAAAELGRLIRAYTGEGDYSVEDVRKAWDLVDRLESAETVRSGDQPEPGELMIDTDRDQPWGTDHVEVVKVLDRSIVDVLIDENESVYQANYGQYPRDDVCVVARYADDNQGSSYHFPLGRLKPLYK